MFRFFGSSIFADARRCPAGLDNRWSTTRIVLSLNILILGRNEIDREYPTLAPLIQ